MKFSYSRVSTYLSCPYKHYLGYVENLTTIRPVRPLRFGGDFHKLLELRNNPVELKKAKASIKDTFYEMPPGWQSDIGENYIQDIAQIFSDYNKVYMGTVQPTVTEQKFELEITKYKGEPIIFHGIIDELYKYKRNGKRAIKIGEHKTFSKKPDYNTLVMNTQKCLYAKAAQFTTGVLPHAVIWDYIKSTPAAEPIYLEKSNRFSEAKSDKITPFSWARALKRKGVTQECPAQYKNNIPNHFFRVEMELYDTMVDDIWDGFVYTAKDIARQGHCNKTKNITMDCNKWCSYRDICFSELTGGDTKYLINKNYTVRVREEALVDGTTTT